jgi:hypothetical protein
MSARVRTRRIDARWKHLERHPLSAEYHDLTGQAFERFVENLKRNGIVNRRKITLYEGKVFDGWQLQRACVETNIKPEYQILELPQGMTPEEFIETANDLRRHETPEQAIKRIQTRQERVAAARQQGQSLRTIAAEEEISESQVRRDLEEASGAPHGAPDDNEGAPPGAPESNGKVRGRDGKTYPASNPAAAVPGIPDRLKRYFANVDLLQQAARLAERLANIFQEIEQTPAYLKAVEGKKHKQYSTYIRTAGRTIASLTPKRPCPDCGGEFEPSQDNDPCKTCFGRGYQTAEEVVQ